MMSRYILTFDFLQHLAYDIYASSVYSNYSINPKDNNNFN